MEQQAAAAVAPPVVAAPAAAPAPVAPAAESAAPKRPAEDVPPSAAASASPAAAASSAAAPGAAPGVPGAAPPPAKRARSASNADLSTYEGACAAYKKFVSSFVTKLKEKLAGGFRSLTKDEDLKASSLLHFEVQPDGFRTSFPVTVLWRTGRGDQSSKELLPGVSHVVPPDASSDIEQKLDSLADDRPDGSMEIASKTLIEQMYKLWDNLGMNQKLKVPHIYAFMHDDTQRFDFRAGVWVSADDVEEEEEEEDAGGKDDARDRDAPHDE